MNGAFSAKSRIAQKRSVQKEVNEFDNIDVVTFCCCNSQQVTPFIRHKLLLVTI